MSATWSAAPTAVVPHTTHPSLTEPVLRRHLREAHGWARTRSLLSTYFVALVAHNREHRKAKLAASA